MVGTRGEKVADFMTEKDKDEPSDYCSLAVLSDYLLTFI